MTLGLALVVGFLTGRLTWLLLRPTLALPVFRRENYRDRPVTTAAGIVIGVSVVVVGAVRIVVARMGVGHADPVAIGHAVVIAALGYGLLGLLDDLAGGHDSRGFGGHVTALARGSMTTGALKLAGGVAVGVVATAAIDTSGAGRLLFDGALVALSANLANLFDRAPGRTAKVGLVGFAALAFGAHASSRLGPVALAVGAMGALFLEDLHERAMLGDTGANVVGGLLGLGVVATCSPLSRLVVLGVVATLNVASEWVSFSAAIDGIAPLRILDRAGRRA